MSPWMGVGAASAAIALFLVGAAVVGLRAGAREAGPSRVRVIREADGVRLDLPAARGPITWAGTIPLAVLIACAAAVLAPILPVPGLVTWLFAATLLIAV